MGFQAAIAWNVDTRAIPRKHAVALLDIVRHSILVEAAQFEALVRAVNADDGGRGSMLIGHDVASLHSSGVRCMLIAELLVLSIVIQGGGPSDAHQAFFTRLLTFGPVVRPVSDNLAVSVIALTLVARRGGFDVGEYLMQVANHICDYYDDEIGLAAPGQTPEDELWRTVGNCVERPGYGRRSSSYLAAAVLDLCSILRLPDLYNAAMHDFTVADVMPYRHVPKEEPAQYQLGQGGVVMATKGDYSEQWKGEDGWRNSHLHHGADAPRWFDRPGLEWVGIALIPGYSPGERGARRSSAN